MHRLFSLIFFVLVSQKQFFVLATYFNNLSHPDRREAYCAAKRWAETAWHPVLI